MLSEDTLQAGKALTAKVTVRNSGGLPGTEVTELYLVPPKAPGAPRLTLAGFQRADLQPNQSQELTFTLDASQMSTVDATGKRLVRSGTYHLFVGSVQPDLNRDRGSTFRVTGDVALLF